MTLSSQAVAPTAQSDFLQHSVLSKLLGHVSTQHFLHTLLWKNRLWVSVFWGRQHFAHPWLRPIQLIEIHSRVAYPFYLLPQSSAFEFVDETALPILLVTNNNNGDENSISSLLVMDGRWMRAGFCIMSSNYSNCAFRVVNACCLKMKMHTWMKDRMLEGLASMESRVALRQGLRAQCAVCLGDGIIIF